MRVGRIPYVNAYPVYGAIDRGVVPFAHTLVSGVPTSLNQRMAAGTLDVSVISTVEYARDAGRYLLLPDLAISCDGPVRSVLLFSSLPATELDGCEVVVSRSSMTSVALLELLFQHVWGCRPRFLPGDAEIEHVRLPRREGEDGPVARLVIGDAALFLVAEHGGVRSDDTEHDRFRYDLGEEWKRWTGLPFVFAVWVAQRSAPAAEALAVHGALLASRDWGVAHTDTLSAQAALATGVDREICRSYLAGLDYRLSYEHLAGLTEFFRRLVAAGRVPNGTLSFLPAA